MGGYGEGSTKFMPWAMLKIHAPRLHLRKWHVKTCGTSKCFFYILEKNLTRLPGITTICFPGEQAGQERILPAS